MCAVSDTAPAGYLPAFPVDQQEPRSNESGSLCTELLKIQLFLYNTIVMNTRTLFSAFLSCLVLLVVPVAAQIPLSTLPEPLGIAMENWPYPYPVRFISLNTQGQDVRMAYMDVKPTGTSNGKTVVLLHGKNFFGAYWQQTIQELTGKGFRVVVPDQIGFGKSSKPDIHYSFHLLARNTRMLLDSLGINRVAVVGHSMGGMLATRFALLYPDVTTHLVLENPIGLEDYRIKIPYVTIEETYRQELTKSEESIRQYHKTYYVEWKPDYDTYVQAQYRWTLGGEAPRLAMSSALTYDMIYTQPVVHEFPQLRVPTLLIIGQADRTAIGKASVSKEVAATLGNYPELGKKTAKAIPGSTLVELPNVGHIPHLESPAPFFDALLKFL
jgi:pimeloyl-ACP methyl ester carboxylesterase